MLGGKLGHLAYAHSNCAATKSVITTLPYGKQPSVAVLRATSRQVLACEAPEGTRPQPQGIRLKNSAGFSSLIANQSSVGLR